MTARSVPAKGALLLVFLLTLSACALPAPENCPRFEHPDDWASVDADRVAAGRGKARTENERRLAACREARAEAAKDREAMETAWKDWQEKDGATAQTQDKK